MNFQQKVTVMACLSFVVPAINNNPSMNHSVVSLLLTVGCVFGCASLIYDYGVLDWLQWDSLKVTDNISCMSDHSF
jgi:hypothetical protein